MKGEVLIYIEGTEDRYKLYRKDIESACSLYYGLEERQIYIDRLSSTLISIEKRGLNLSTKTHE